MFGKLKKALGGNETEKGTFSYLKKLIDESDGTEFTQNIAGRKGGAIFNEKTGTIEAENCEFSKNEAPDDKNISGEDDDLTLKDCRIKKNRFF